MKIALLLCLLFPLQQSNPDIAIIYDGQTVIMPLANAERLYRSDLAAKDNKLRAALEIALGTLPSNKPDNEVLSVQDRERFRWQRRALQRRRN